MPDDYHLLKLGGLTSLIKSIDVSLWGNKVTVECVYDPTEHRLSYVLIFQDCLDINWSVHSPEEVNEVETDMIGFSIGVKSHQQAAVITTDIFELSIIYGSFVIQKNW